MTTYIPTHRITNESSRALVWDILSLWLSLPFKASGSSLTPLARLTSCTISCSHTTLVSSFPLGNMNLIRLLFPLPASPDDLELTRYIQHYKCSTSDTGGWRRIIRGQIWPQGSPARPCWCSLALFLVRPRMASNITCQAPGDICEYERQGNTSLGKFTGMSLSMILASGMSDV